jgi:hypothetical protein
VAPKVTKAVSKKTVAKKQAAAKPVAKPAAKPAAPQVPAHPVQPTPVPQPELKKQPK